MKNEFNVVYVPQLKVPLGPRSVVRGLEQSPVLVYLYACRLFIHCSYKVIYFKFYICRHNFVEYELQGSQMPLL